eukprot:741198-Prorocentrum_minimum.AAC.3
MRTLAGPLRRCWPGTLWNPESLQHPGGHRAGGPEPWPGPGLTQVVTYNPDAEVLTLATVEFNFLTGGDFKATTNVGAIHLRPFNYRLSTWDAAYGFQVPGPSCFRGSSRFGLFCPKGSVRGLQVKGPTAVTFGMRRPRAAGHPRGP